MRQSGGCRLTPDVPRTWIMVTQHSQLCTLDMSIISMLCSHSMFQPTPDNELLSLRVGGNEVKLNADLQL